MTDHDIRLLLAAGGAMLVLLFLVVRLRQHPFLGLCLATLLMGVTGGYGLGASITSLKNGVGETTASVGLVVVFGTMLGSVLAESGATVALARAIMGDGKRYVELRVALLAGLIGLPMFFESGLALLMPLIVTLAGLNAGRGNINPYIRLGMPALAMLSVLHGFVPPHPGPAATANLLGADLGRVILLGLVLAIPLGAVAGLVLPRLTGRGITGTPPAELTGALTSDVPRHPAHWGPALAIILLPALLIAARSAAGALGIPSNDVLNACSDPVAALLVTLLLAIPLLGLKSGCSADEIAAGFTRSMISAAPIILVVAAGGGFKRVLVDSGAGAAIAHAVPYLGLPPLAMGWGVTVLIRLTTGSSTVAGITAAGIMAGVIAGDPHVDKALMVLAIGAGSLFLSHVNDAGFWQVRGYFGLSLAETFKTWSLTSVFVSVLGLAGVIGLSFLTA